MNFAKKVVIITGASSGIGRATALRFAEHKVKLVIIGRDEKKLKAMAAECEDKWKNKPLVVVAELTEEADVRNIVDQTIDEYGSVDVLVNNAATLELGGIEYTSMQQFDNCFNTNVRSVYQLTMLVVPYLVKTRGCIVNVSSVNSLRPYPFSIAYNMSKRRWIR